jgi:hypothetical protein
VLREVPVWRQALMCGSASARREVLWQLVWHVQSQPFSPRGRPPPDIVWTPLGQVLQRARRRYWALQREQR